MGVGCSKCGCSDTRHSSRNSSMISAGRPLRADSGVPPIWEQERAEAMRLLREEFKHRPNVFLLSQIMMSVQFFRNFDKDKLRIMQLKQEKDAELDASLQKDKKSAAYLGSPYEVIGEVMAYRRKDGEEPCLGHDLEYLIIHDSIAVLTPSDEPEPEQEAKDYQVVMQKCRSEGYTRLRLTGRIRPPTSSRRSRLSARQSRDWQRQPPLAQVHDEVEPSSSERSPQPGGGPESGVAVNGTGAVSPSSGGKDGRAAVAVKTETSADDRPPVGRNSTGETREDVRHKKRTEPPNGPGRDQRDTAKSGGSKPEETPSRGSSRPHSTADSLSDGSSRGSSSSSLSSNKELSKTPPENSTSQGKGQEFLEKLKRKIKGDNSADINLSDEQLSDGEEAENKASQKPTVTVTDETGTTDAKPSPETGSGSKPTAPTAQQMAGFQQPTQYPSFPGQIVNGSPWFPAANGMPMFNNPESYQRAALGQGAPTPGQGVPRDRSAHFPGHVPTPSPFVPPMGAPGPFLFPGSMPGYPGSPDNVTQFPMHPAVPHYFPLQPGINPYQQFAGMYPISPPPAGWPTGQSVPVGPQPYLPGVPLANQNPAVGFGMPGFPGQPVPHGYPFLYAAPPTSNGPFNTISEGRAAGKSSRRPNATSSARRSSKNHLVPPPPHQGARRSSSQSSKSLVNEIRRLSNASSTSRYSYMQDSTTTDDELDAPGHVPSFCFRKVKVRVDAGDDDDEDVWREPHFEGHHFLSSTRFLGVFADRFGELVRMMARDSWLQHGGRGQLSGPVVQCREVLRSGLRTTARVTPTLLVASWPSEQAFEWALRRRPEQLDVRRKVRYVWPPQRVVQCILQEVGCNLVPVGSRRGLAPELEWEIAFQQAEIKLISSLDLVHVHCWAVAKLFFTHFLSEFDCLQERHIRHLMFWQFEKNFRDWHLQSLGATLVELISSLKESVRHRRLEHYFIRKRNLLQSETTGSLVNAQERLQRVMENLLPNVIILMSRLQVRDEAFPTLDWQTLYDNLRMSPTDIMRKLIPELSRPKGDSQFSSRDSLTFNPRNYITEEDDGWNNLTRRQQIESSYRRWQAEQQQAQKQRQRQVQRAFTRPGAPMPAFAGPNDSLYTLGDRFQPRTEMVLSLFIRHFSAMAEKLIEHKSIYTALAYIDHSMDLCTLLSEEGASETADLLREKLLELQAIAAAELPPPEEEEVPQVDPDLLQMASGGGAAPEERSNWTVGHKQGRAMRRDFNREAAAAAAAGDEAEWQAQGGTRPETEGRDEARPSAGRDPFGGSAILGEMRINPAFEEDQPKAEDDDADDADVVDDVEVVEEKTRTSRGEADGSEDLEESPHGGPAVGRSGARGSIFIEEDDDGADDEEDDEDEMEDGVDALSEDEASGGENEQSLPEAYEAAASDGENRQSQQEEEDDEDDEDTQM